MPKPSISLRKKDMFDLDTVEDFDPFKSTSRVFFSPIANSAAATRMNFKKKTPFTQFVNASFCGGVFFNAPAAGL